jgi:hypothetical protein
MHTQITHLLLLALHLLCTAATAAAKRKSLPPNDTELDLLAKYTITSRTYKGSYDDAFSLRARVMHRSLNAAQKLILFNLRLCRSQ